MLQLENNLDTNIQIVLKAFIDVQQTNANRSIREMSLSHEENQCCFLPGGFFLSTRAHDGILKSAIGS